ncbi:unnamed protein product [Calypogeia fissa]
MGEVYPTCANGTDIEVSDIIVEIANITQPFYTVPGGTFQGPVLVNGNVTIGCFGTAEFDLVNVYPFSVDVNGTDVIIAADWILSSCWSNGTACGGGFQFLQTETSGTMLVVKHASCES